MTLVLKPLPIPLERVPRSISFLYNIGIPAFCFYAAGMLHNTYYSFFLFLCGVTALLVRLE